MNLLKKKYMIGYDFVFYFIVVKNELIVLKLYHSKHLF